MYCTLYGHNIYFSPQCGALPWGINLCVPNNEDCHSASSCAGSLSLTFSLSLSHGSRLFGASLHKKAIRDIDDSRCIMSMSHCVSSAARDIEHGWEGGHFALQEKPHNLVASNAVAYIATSQKGMACTPRDPKCGRFLFVFLDFGQIPPPAFFGQPWPATRLGTPRKGRTSDIYLMYERARTRPKRFRLQVVQITEICTRGGGSAALHTDSNSSWNKWLDLLPHVLHPAQSITRDQ